MGSERSFEYLKDMSFSVISSWIAITDCSEFGWKLNAKLNSNELNSRFTFKRAEERVLSMKSKRVKSRSRAVFAVTCVV